jgi:hypothetical protein
LMNTRITLPVSYNLKKWDFEIGYNLILTTSVMTN